MRRADLKRLDPALYQAMNQRLVTESMPEDIDLPTRKQFNDRWVERVQSGEEAPPVMAEAADRFRAAAHARNKQADSSTGTVSRQ
ncbi:MAG: hypothetical protein HZY74_08300 [Brevundimonas sp.]|nr:MAG: hypothetical protein HZY74_08300 [Brevundimonas sp.]